MPSPDDVVRQSDTYIAVAHRLGKTGHIGLETGAYKAIGWSMRAEENSLQQKAFNVRETGAGSLGEIRAAANKAVHAVRDFSTSIVRFSASLKCSTVQRATLVVIDKQAEAGLTAGPLRSWRN